MVSDDHTGNIVTPDQVLGVDIGTRNFLTCSDGTIFGGRIYGLQYTDLIEAAKWILRKDYHYIAFEEGMTKLSAPRTNVCLLPFWSFLSNHTGRPNIVLVPKALSSQQCSVCGNCHNNVLDQFWFACTGESCGYHDNRDNNSSKNLVSRCIDKLNGRLFHREISYLSSWIYDKPLGIDDVRKLFDSRHPTLRLARAYSAQCLLKAGWTQIPNGSTEHARKWIAPVKESFRWIMSDLAKELGLCTEACRPDILDWHLLELKKKNRIWSLTQLAKRLLKHGYYIHTETDVDHQKIRDAGWIVKTADNEYVFVFPQIVGRESGFWGDDPPDFPKLTPKESFPLAMDLIADQIGYCEEANDPDTLDHHFLRLHRSGRIISIRQLWAKLRQYDFFIDYKSKSDYQRIEKAGWKIKETKRSTIYCFPTKPELETGVDKLQLALAEIADEVGTCDEVRNPHLTPGFLRNVRAAGKIMVWQELVARLQHEYGLVLKIHGSQDYHKVERHNWKVIRAGKGNPTFCFPLNGHSLSITFKDALQKITDQIGVCPAASNPTMTNQGLCFFMDQSTGKDLSDCTLISTYRLKEELGKHGYLLQKPMTKWEKDFLELNGWRVKQLSYSTQMSGSRTACWVVSNKWEEKFFVNMAVIRDEMPTFKYGELSFSQMKELHRLGKIHTIMSLARRLRELGDYVNPMNESSYDLIKKAGFAVRRQTVYKDREELMFDNYEKAKGTAVYVFPLATNNDRTQQVIDFNRAYQQQQLANDPIADFDRLYDEQQKRRVTPSLDIPSFTGTS